MNVKIIYEDVDVLVVNKPTGLIVHSDGKKDKESEEYSLADWVLEKYPEMKDVGEPAEYNSKTIARPGIVHRLDRDTSGVMVIAKNQKSFECLKQQFQNRKIKKTYRAFVYGNIKSDEGVVDRAIGRSAKNFKMWSAERGARGQLREAVTEYKVLNRLKDGDEHIAYVELYPKTGRTHQLRVHMKAIGNPIVCDSLYAPKRACLLGLKSLALHAYKLELQLPSGKAMKFEAELPEGF